MASLSNTNGTLEIKVTNNFKKFIDNIRQFSNWDNICNKYYLTGDSSRVISHTIYTITTPNNTNFVLMDGSNQVTKFYLQESQIQIPIKLSGENFNSNSWVTYTDVNDLTAALKYTGPYETYRDSKLLNSNPPDQAVYYNPGNGITNSTIVLHNISRYYIDNSLVKSENYGYMKDIYNAPGVVYNTANIRLKYRISYTQPTTYDDTPKFKITETSILCTCNNGTPSWKVSHKTLDYSILSMSSC